jgi:hypothetical protein
VNGRINGYNLPSSGDAAGAILGTDGSGNLSWVNGRMVLETSKASTSGTSIDFTGIPSWVKKITVMFDGVSTNGSSLVEVRLGTSGGIVATGYVSTRGGTTPSLPFCNSSTTGFFVGGAGAAAVARGHLLLTNLSGNLWIGSGTLSEATNVASFNAGTVTLSGTLDRIRITTVNGTDTFDAGSINLLLEG